MAKYLYHGSYTLEGVKGLLAEGGSSRRDTVEKSLANLGGKMEAFYYAFGSDDYYVTFELPDGVTTAAFALAVAAGGGARGSTVVLLTPEEVDQATKKVGSITYRAPGQGR
ncbi:MAG: GYD domain-containing protein [Chloroflexota bacterium]